MDDQCVKISSSFEINNNKTLDEYKCAVSKDDHFIKVPITLNCGHSVCKSCLYQEGSKTLVCKRCDKKIQNEAKYFEENSFIKQAFEDNLNALLMDINKQAISSLGEIKDYISSHDERIENIDSKIELVKDQVVLRVEVLKKELDTMKEGFFNRLDKIKQQVVEVEKYTLTELNDHVKTIELKLNDLKTFLNKQESQNLETFYEFQNTFRSTKRLANIMNDMYFEVKLEASTENINDGFVGKILKNTNYQSYREEIENEEVMRSLKYSKFDEIELDKEQKGFCSLKNGNLIFHDNETISLYDKNFNLIKRVDEFDGKKLKPGDLAYNMEKNWIYLIDFEIQRLIIIDKDLNKIKKARPNNSKPTSISYRNGFLYACDRDDKKVYKCESDLSKCYLFNLNYSPLDIKVSDNLALISANHCFTQAIYFHELTDFSIRHKYHHHDGAISELHSYFYELCWDGFVYCYDKNGILINEFKKSEFADYFEYGSPSNIHRKNQDIYILCPNLKKLLKFKLKSNILK